MERLQAIVLGIDTPIGLTIVRELGRNGVAVHGIARDERAVGLYSRYLHKGYRRTGDEAATVALIGDIARRTGARHVMAISESDILMLNRRRADLAGLALLVPDSGPMDLVLDKAKANRAASRVGIEVPRSIAVEHSSEIVSKLDGIRFPVVLKWADPNRVAAELSSRGLTLRKAQYCYSPADLRAALAPFDPIGAYPLIQEFCPGYGLGHMIFMHDGKPVLKFRHRRVREWPPEGGVSSLCRSLGPDADAALFDKSVALLREIGWRGAAMVEYRFDPDTGRAVFMEVNGRFWGSIPLAYHAGAWFAWHTFNVLGLGREPATERDYAVGMSCRYFMPDLHRMFRIMMHPELIENRALSFGRWRTLAGFVADYFRPGMRYYVFTWRDPLPCLADLGFAFLKAVRAVLPAAATVPLRKRPAMK